MGDRLISPRSLIVMVLVLTWGCLAGSGSVAQQPKVSPGWLTVVPPPPVPGAETKAPPAGNTTVVPRAPSAEPKVQAGQGSASATQVTLVALLTQDGQRIDQGLVWRVFQESNEGSEANRRKLVATHREASPVLRLPPGEYIVNAAFGRAHLTRRITVKSGVQSVEPFVLNAGGLRLAALVGNGEPAAPNTVTYDIYSDERDQFGNRTKIMGGAKPGLIIRLNSGIYHIVSTYGDANAQVRADVTVEAGKLTEATVAHAAAKVTFKLVTRPGGEALADTQWSVLDAQGDTVKDSVGALPTHTLAPGTYTVTAKSGGRVFRREFSVRHGESAQIEVVMQ
jgi:hypothetical protein